MMTNIKTQKMKTEKLKTQGKIFISEILNLNKSTIRAKSFPKVFILYNTELFQSINPFWVIALTPVIVAFWACSDERKRTFNAYKIVLGLFISALSCLVMVFAVYAGDNGAVKFHHRGG